MTEEKKLHEWFIEVLVDEIKQKSDSEIEEFLEKDFTSEDLDATNNFLKEE